MATKQNITLVFFLIGLIVGTYCAVPESGVCEQGLEGASANSLVQVEIERAGGWANNCFVSTEIFSSKDGMIWFSNNVGGMLQ